MASITSLDAPVAAPEAEFTAPDRPPAARTIDHRRLAGPATIAALCCSVLAAVGQALGAVAIGRVAERPVWPTVGVLALCVIGAAVLDTVGRVAWTAVVDRAEGRLRADLLDAVMAQPVAVLSEQAVGEILDRIDDDTHELGTLLRVSVWRVIRVAMLVLPLVIVAGFAWWPAWILFPVVALLVVNSVRPLLVRLAEAKVREEAAWSDHAAAMEEGIAARDDLRTSLGRPFLVRRCAELASTIHSKMGDVVRLEAQIMRRTGLLLAGLLAAVAAIGVSLADAGRLGTAMLVTLFAVTATFVGQVDQVAHHLPDLQSGVGALIRLRALMATEPEPTGGATAPRGPVQVEFRNLDFAYPNGTFALDGVSLTIPAGTACALVGRSGSGKTTLTMLLSRAVEPQRGTVLLDGVDVLDLELDSLRSTVGLVTQRTEILAATLAENIAMFADIDRARIEAAVDELGIGGWVASLSDGLDTPLGAGGTTLSAGEEQLVAFARLLVRDVGVIVLDEATARMDPVTEAQVVEASRRLLHGRTGIIVAHRLGTTERAEQVAVLDAGRVIQHGLRARLADEDGPFRRLLLDAAATEPGLGRDGVVGTGRETVDDASQNGRRRSAAPPPAPLIPDPPSFASAVRRACTTRPEWGLLAIALFMTFTLLSAYGVATSWVWGKIVVDLDAGDDPTWLVVLLVAGLLVSPLALAEAIRRFPHWWISVLLRVRTSVLVAQTDQRRLPVTPPGEVVARALDADRFARIGDRWFDFAAGLLIVTVTALFAGTPLAGAVLLGIMAATAILSALGSPVAGRTAAASSTARAQFGRSLVSSLDAIRTVKLSASTTAVQRHLGRVDGGRVDAAVREHRIQSMLDGVPVILVQGGVVVAWATYTAGGWGLATALLVSGTVLGFEWFGRVAGAVITEAPGTRAWHRTTSRLAAGSELMDLPAGVDLVTGSGEPVTPGVVDPFEHLDLVGFEARHPDGTVGVHGIDLRLGRGELVLVLGRVGSGKSSLLGALAGLVQSTGIIRWNGEEVLDRETFLRPRRVGYVAQLPRVLSGSFLDNIRLDHDRPVEAPIAQAQLAPDIADAGGTDALVGHRGVRLSGGQTQRLALARALATESEVLVADDVSSALDATTEVELWEAMRASGRTVIGSTTKRSALERADRVVVLVDGTIAAQGPWSVLSPDWHHLAG
ncbi:MAG: ABC transporter ATP-binding protein [Actinomycetota bacterium]